MLGEAAREREDLVTLLQQESEGNTFFLGELARSLAEGAGHLSQVVQLEQLPEQIMTGGMQALLQRRLARLPEAYHPILKASAVDWSPNRPELASASQFVDCGKRVDPIG